MGKFYAVKVGRELGIFRTWEECRKRVEGYPNSIYKSFSNYEEAYSFIYGENSFYKEKDDEKLEVSDITAYIDGSYDDKIKYYGYAGIIFYNNEKIEFSFSGNEVSIIKQRNVAGEIKASMYVLNFALEERVKSIEIFYDYAGIEKWATKEWEAKNDFTKLYVKYIDDIKENLSIKFTKVKAHSGNKYNEEVDQLAKSALTKVKENNITNFIIKEEIDYINLMDKVQTTKKSLNTSFIVKGRIYTQKDIYDKLKKKWENEKRKLKEIVEIKSIFDTNTSMFVFYILNDMAEWEIFQLYEEDL